MPKLNKIDSFRLTQNKKKHKLNFNDHASSSHSSIKTGSMKSVKINHNPAFSRNPLKSPFCTDLKAAVEYDRKHLKEKDRHIPVILESMVEVMETNLDLEGIYRINGAASRMKKMQQSFIDKWREQKEGWIRSIHYVSVWAQIEYEGCDTNFDDGKNGDPLKTSNSTDFYKSSSCKPHDVAGLIKRYLRELQDPLLSNMYSILFLTADKITDLKEKLRAICLCFLLLTNVHKKTTLYVLRHLKKVCEKHRENKMTLTNVAVCLSPCFFSLSETEPGFSADQMKQATNVCKIMIKYADVLNYLPAEILRQTRKARESLNQMNKNGRDGKVSKGQVKTRNLGNNLDEKHKIGTHGSGNTSSKPANKHSINKFNKYFKNKSEVQIDTSDVAGQPINTSSIKKPTIAKIGMVPSSFTPPCLAPRFSDKSGNDAEKSTAGSLADYNILQIQIDDSVHDHYHQNSNPRPQYKKPSVTGGRTSVGMVFDETTVVSDVIAYCIPIVIPIKVLNERDDLINKINSMSRDSVKTNEEMKNKHVNIHDQTINRNLHAHLDHTDPNLKRYALFEVGGNLTRRRLPSSVHVKKIRDVNPEAGFVIKYC